MIHAVIELGDQRVHEVMVPRIAMVTLRRRRPRSRTPSTWSSRRATRASRCTRSSVDEIVGILYAKDLLPFLKAGAPDAAGPAHAAADAGLRARVDERRRPAPRAPAPQGPPRHRPRRVRRHGRPGDDRGPARGDRRRDPGRVRRGGADDRRAVRRRGAGRRPGRRRRPGRAVRHRARARGRGRVRHRRRAHLPPHRRRAQARRPGVRRRPDPDRRDRPTADGSARSSSCAPGRATTATTSRTTRRTADGRAEPPRRLRLASSWRCGLAVGPWRSAHRPRQCRAAIPCPCPSSASSSARRRIFLVTVAQRSMAGSVPQTLHAWSCARRSAASCPRT